MFCRIGLPIVLAVVIAVEAKAADGNRGSIEGLIESGQASSVIAINRTDGKRFPSKVAAAKGNFGITGLPLDATYDLIIDFAGARLEGIDLKVPPSDYVEEQPLSKEDIAIIREKARRMNKFEDVVEIKTIQGNIQHATVFLNKLRTRPFFGSKPGEVIWRAELWHFEKPEETWVKDQDELGIVLYRERIQSAVYAAKSHTFDQSLGGIELTDEKPNIDLGVITAPIAKRGIHFRLTRKKAPTGPTEKSSESLQPNSNGG